MKNFNLRNWTVPLALLVLCLLSFGLLAPWLGFYWDDWPTVWYLHLLGGSGFRDVFAIDRPLLGWLFMLTTPILGQSTLAWQVFGVLTRWVCCLSVWWSLKALWPARTREVTWVALLFAAYPGFTQHFISVTYSHVWIIMAAFFMSYGAMVWAIRNPRRFWPGMVASWLLAAYTLFTSEYYFGLELIRPVLLYWALGSSSQEAEQAREKTPLRKRLLRVLQLWLPYIAMIAAFLYWRLVVHETPRGHVLLFDQLFRNPLGTALNLAGTALQDIFQSSFLAWAQVFDFSRLTSFGKGPTLLYFAVLVASLPLALLFVLRYQPQAEEGAASGRPTWARQAILLGTLALLLGGIPFWVTTLPIELRFPWDRFTLAMMFGASLLVAGLLALLPGKRLASGVILGALIGLAVGFHVQDANLYRREWNSQKEFFWQLVWRAPGLKSGTTLLTAELPFAYYSDNSLTAPLNWIYAPGNHSREMPYMFYAVESRMKNEYQDVEKGADINQQYRATTFTGSTSQIVAVFYAPPGCVKIADPVVDATMPQKPKSMSDILPLSSLDLVLADPEIPARPPQNIFGEEIAHGWCYYFEKADLARQLKDWETAAAFGDEGLKLNQRLYEVNAPELVPLIEAYAHVGRWEQAQSLTSQAYALSFRMDRMLCATWNRIDQEAAESAEKSAAVDRARQELKCKAP